MRSCAMATQAAPGATGRLAARACRARAGTFSNSVVMAAHKLAKRSSPAVSVYAVCTWWWLTKPAGLWGSGSSTAVK